jgi:DNA-binding NtrC family response regulator
MKSDSSGKILVVDDDRDVLFTAKLVMKGLFEKVDTLERPGLIPEFLKSCKYDVVILDMNFSRGDTSGKEGIAWLERILHIDPEAHVLATTAYGEINLAVQAMKMGASDFIVKPWNKDQLISSVQNVIRLKHRKHDDGVISPGTEADNAIKGKYPEMISRSKVMARILETIKTVAPTDANVLIMARTGRARSLQRWHCTGNLSEIIKSSFMSIWALFLIHFLKLSYSGIHAVPLLMQRRREQEDLRPLQEGRFSLMR